MELLDKLGENALFQDIQKREMALLSPLVSLATFQAGDTIFDADQKIEYFYIVETGSFMVHLSNAEHKTLFPGDLFGEIGVINGDFRSGNVTAVEPSTAIKISGTRLFSGDVVPSSTALKILKALSKHVTSYLRSREQISTREIIDQGENDHVEFKSTLRWNLYTKKRDRVIENAVLKTVAAFMNTNGGILLVGVDDDGQIIGLEYDNFKNDDKLLLHFAHIFKQRIGPRFLKYLRYSVEAIDHKKVLRVDCTPALSPVYFKDKTSDYLFIRSGPSSISLRLSEAFTYINERFC